MEWRRVEVGCPLSVSFDLFIYSTFGLDSLFCEN